MSYYLGFDSSTQSLKAIIIDTEKGQIVCSESVNFGKELPEYSCLDGVLQNENPNEKHSNPLMWLDALDLVLKKLFKNNAPLEKVCGISGCGQQHGSVYLKENFPEVLRKMVSDKGLSEQILPALSRKTAPVWMDSSTGEECREISKKIGGRLQEDTGSPAIERFTGPQIRRFYKKEPENYQATKHIALVSSFICSVLCGKIAPIDFGDGSGMNLLNLKSLKWDKEIAEATAPNLLKKLPEGVRSNFVVGTLNPYFQKYGFGEDVKVSVWTGDNPASLIGTGAWQPGTAVISLGTSDTFFAACKNPLIDPNGYGHVFGNPAGGFMNLICFKNGSLAREKVKDDCKVDWDYFGNTAFENTPAGNNENFILPYFVSENTPLVKNAGVKLFGNTNLNSSEFIRAVVESQFTSMKLHSQFIGIDFETIRVTGGGSNSPGICQTIANIFQAKVEKISITDSAALGAAMIAASSLCKISFEELKNKFCKAEKIINPDKKTANIYDNLLQKYKKAEKANIR